MNSMIFFPTTLCMSNVMCISSIIVFVYTSSIVPVGCVLYMFSCYNKIILKKNWKNCRSAMLWGDLDLIFDLVVATLTV